MYRTIAVPLFAASLLLSTTAAAQGVNAMQPVRQAAHATPAHPSVPQTPAAPTPAANSATISLPTITVEAKLNLAREDLNPATGTSSYFFSPQAIRALPQGENTSLQHLLLQAPGVVKDSSGQIHVRGDHADLQYRINGILLPEFISGFGSALGTRFANNVSLITGSLPAQYGYRTAGVVNITTKDGQTNGGSADLYGGSYATIKPSLQYGGSDGNLSYYATGGYLQSNLGIESPTPAADPEHDHTEQNRGFFYTSYRLNENTRAGVMFGHFLGNFQIPNNPGQTPVYQLQGVTSYPSSQLNATQRELGDYGIAFLQGYRGPLDYQLSLTYGYSSVTYNPDEIGDLIYNGVASRVFRRNISTGLQEDTSYAFDVHHTLRWGLFLDRERTTSDNTSAVFPADADGNQTSDIPLSIVDTGGITGKLWGIYMQDQWQPLGSFTLNYGLRYDVSSGYVREDQLSPRVNFVWDVTDSTSLHGGYSRYFTPPTFELITPTDIALFQGTTNQLPSDVNTNVKSERDNYYDIGVIHSFTSNWKAGLDAYYKDAENLLDEGQFGQALVYSPFNYAKGRIWGIEFTNNYTVGNWSSYFNLAYSKAMGRTIVSGQYNFDPDELAYINSHWVNLDHEQIWTASGGVGYDWNGTHVNLDAIFGSGLHSGFANTESLPSYTVFNFGVWRVFHAGKLGDLSVRLALVNMFDRVYEINDGEGIGAGAPKYGERRGIYLGISKEF